MRPARPISCVFRPARRFLRREGGNAVIESVLLLPLLLWAAFGLYVFWDGYKVSNKLQKASYTVADIASRWQAVPLAASDVRGMQSLMEYMISEGDEPRLRVTRVGMTYGEQMGQATITLEGEYLGNSVSLAVPLRGAA